MYADSTSYKHITADGLVYNGATQLYGIVLTAGSDTATLVLYDWTSAIGGAVIQTIKAAANTSHSVVFRKPISVRTGIYADLSGTSPTADLYMDGDFTSTSTTTSTSTSTSTTAT